jgi:hypothetical protein
MNEQQEAMEKKIKELRELARNADSITESLRLHAEACVLEERLIHLDR